MLDDLGVCEAQRAVRNRSMERSVELVRLVVLIGPLVGIVVLVANVDVRRGDEEGIGGGGADGGGGGGEEKVGVGLG